MSVAGRVVPVLPLLTALTEYLGHEAVAPGRGRAEAERPRAPAPSPGEGCGGRVASRDLLLPAEGLRSSSLRGGAPRRRRRLASRLFSLRLGLGGYLLAGSPSSTAAGAFGTPAGQRSSWRVCFVPEHRALFPPPSPRGLCLPVLKDGAGRSSPFFPSSLLWAALQARFGEGASTAVLASRSLPQESVSGW